MTVSASTSAAQQSPLQHLLGSIASKASAGSISATDATALSEAATDIDSTLSGGASASGKSSARLSPADMKTRVESLVDGEVEKGTLTTEQASTLKEILSQNAPQGGPGGAGGPGGSRGAGGPPPGLPPDDAASDDSSTSSTSSTSSGTGTSTADLLKSFIAQLRSAQSDTSTYGLSSSSTSASSGSRFSALLVDFQT